MSGTEASQKSSRARRVAITVILAGVLLYGWYYLFGAADRTATEFGQVLREFKSPLQARFFIPAKIIEETLTGRTVYLASYDEKGDAVIVSNWSEAGDTPQRGDARVRIAPHR